VVLRIKNLSKSLEYKKILNGISFEIRRGEVVGIIGPNGSGKTTLFNVIAGSLKADEGEIQFLEGVRMDYAIARSEFFGDMTAKNNIKLRCRLLRMDSSKIESEGNIFGLNYLNTLFNSLSAGMKQKVSLTIPFLFVQDLILLDEPTNHLDIESIFILRHKINEYREKGVSFLISSHSFSELEKICDKIIIINKGSMVCCESTRDLLVKYGDFENAYQTLTAYKQ
jgi:ABC-2 type transport system ATP-binding protein